jgi:hypothetical protein
MSEIYDRIIEHPAAWTSRETGSVDRFAYDLSDTQLDAIDWLLSKTRHLRPQQVTRQDFSHPAIDGTLRDFLQTIMHGRGVVLIRGITRERYSEEDFERIYWGFGTHWGNAVTQSSFGDRLGHVRDEKGNNPNRRKYRTKDALKPHTDFFEIVGLMTVQKAASGGLSEIVSALAMHNEIFRTRPELLEPLYRGYYYASSEASSTRNPVTSYHVPIFSCVDGHVSVGYIRRFMFLAAQKRGEMVPPDLVEAIEYFDELAQRDDLRFQFMLEPGQMIVYNNLVTLHGRTDFEDSPGHTRHLLRLWLEVPDGRPVVPAMIARTAEYGHLNV